MARAIRSRGPIPRHPSSAPPTGSPVKKIASTLLLAFVTLSLGMKASDPPGTQMATFADALVDSLDESQRAEAMMDYESSDRSAWHFIPKDDRKGAPLSEMNQAQRTAALRLVRAALSESGYDKTLRVMLIEGVVADLEGEGRRWPRDPNLYYVTLFVKPSDQGTQPSDWGTWGLSFEGHHVSLNFVCRGGKVVDSTPQFLGAHPGTIPADYQGGLPGGTRILQDEEDLAFELINALDEAMQAKAIIDQTPPAEMRFAGDAQPAVDDQRVGIAYADLPPAEQQRLEQLVRVYTDVVADPIAKRRRDLIEKNGWDGVHFAWAGATEPGVGHYYRIRGDEFLIEFVNSQPDALGNPANHVHCVFRDLTGDFDLNLK